jgi:hypothetical protein
VRLCRLHACVALPTAHGRSPSAACRLPLTMPPFVFCGTPYVHECNTQQRRLLSCRPEEMPTGQLPHSCCHHSVTTTTAEVPCIAKADLFEVGLQGPTTGEDGGPPHHAGRANVQPPRSTGTNARGVPLSAAWLHPTPDLYLGVHLPMRGRNWSADSSCGRTHVTPGPHLVLTWVFSLT